MDVRCSSNGDGDDDENSVRGVRVRSVEELVGRVEGRRESVESGVRVGAIDAVVVEEEEDASRKSGLNGDMRGIFGVVCAF